MKTLVIIILSCLAVSCGIPPKPTGLAFMDFIFTKKNGKILTGLKYQSQILLPPEYDRIEFTCGEDLSLSKIALASKGNDIYAYAISDEIFLSDKPLIGKVEYVQDLSFSGHSFDIGQWWRIPTAEGDIHLVGDEGNLYGPYKEFVPCFNGYIFTDVKTGKRGYVGIKFIKKAMQNRYREGSKDNIILRPEYDEIYEVHVDSYQEGWLYAKKDGKEYNFDLQGRLTDRFKVSLNRRIPKIRFCNNIYADVFAFQEGVKGAQKFGHPGAAVVLEDPK